jgi:hypothetical protein
MNAQQEEKKQEAVVQNEGLFASLLMNIMNVIENYKDGEEFKEGDYLKVMNDMKRLYEMKNRLQTEPTIMVMYERIQRRARVFNEGKQRRIKANLTRDEKLRNGYSTCRKCGRLFCNEKGMKRHQAKTLICREITGEKTLAITTQSVERLEEDEVNKQKRHINANLLLLKLHKNNFNELLVKFSNVNNHKNDLQIVRMKKRIETEISYNEINH